MSSRHLVRSAFGPSTARALRRTAHRLGTGALALAVVAGLAPGVVAHEYKAGSLEIEHPWSRATPGGAKVAGGYMVVRNGGAAPDRLVSAVSDVAGRTEIHQMSTADGVMTMRPLAGGIAVPAKGSASLAPGAVHLMFFDLKRPLKQGERFPATLTFEKAGAVEVQFAVEAVGAKGDEHGAGAHGGAHAQ